MMKRIFWIFKPTQRNSIFLKTVGIHATANTVLAKHFVKNAGIEIQTDVGLVVQATKQRIRRLGTTESMRVIVIVLEQER